MTEDRAAAADGRGARILVVEDEAVVALDVERRLERLGYCCAGRAASAGEALRQASELEPDLVLMDVQLHGAGDGIEAGGRIRTELGLPVIYATAFADGPTIDRAKATRPAGYVRKPFDDEDLRAAIEVALARHTAERALRRSREDLQAVLDAQRTGAVLLDGSLRATFLSRAARRLLGGAGAALEGRGLDELLPDPVASAAVRQAALAAPSERHRVLLTVVEGEGWRHLEAEIADDPRDPSCRILFLYDVSESADLRRLLDERQRYGSIVGGSPPMAEVFRLIEDLAPSDAAVLLLGETGTGKELVARAIHERSPRAEGPFLALNCGALRGELAASQLFGHRKGAFTGAAADHIGYFEAADGGTLFLDEIGELSAPVQAALLRTLEEGTIVPLGETAERAVDVRLLAATNRDLAAAVTAGGFRQDLYYRVRVAEIRVPPLRERPGDVPLLARSFLAAARAQFGKPVEAIADDALRALLGYGWPGNVRELKNAVDFATLRSRGTLLRAADLPPEVTRVAAEAEAPPAAGADALRAALSETGGNRKRAARLLGISRATLYRRLKQFGLE